MRVNNFHHFLKWKSFIYFTFQLCTYLVRKVHTLLMSKSILFLFQVLAYFDDEARTFICGTRNTYFIVCYSR